MEKIKPELYANYLRCNNGFATAIGLSAIAWLIIIQLNQAPEYSKEIQQQ
jgi:hypothetical protein